MTVVLLRCAVAIAVLMFAVWLLSLNRKDASIVDIAWGFGFVVVAWTACLSAENAHGELVRTALFLPILTTVWGLRLSGHLYWRNHGKPEDYRYQTMRKKWGKAFPLVSLFTVFALQGVIMWVVSLPVQAGAFYIERHVAALLFVGVVLWAVGLFFESVGDWQLARFKSVPQNQDRVLDTGLWRYTRHPNYFGDFLVWWGLYFVSFSLTGAWWTIVGPIIMTLFLRSISGVTLLEKSLQKSKPKYASYVARTNAFFPGPPRP